MKQTMIYIDEYINIYCDIDTYVKDNDIIFKKEYSQRISELKKNIGVKIH